MNELDDILRARRRRWVMVDILLFIVIAGACGYYGFWSPILGLFQ